MSISNETCIRNLLGILVGNIHLHVESLPRKRQVAILPHIDSLIRRWYYSALADSTALSPANLWNAIAAHFNTDSQSEPLMKAVLKKNHFSLSFFLASYRQDMHIIISDLKKTIEAAAPHVDYTEKGELPPKFIATLSMQVSIFGYSYAQFLIEIAILMDLLVYEDNIHTTRIAPADDCDAFFERPGHEMLKEVLTASIKYSARMLGNVMPVFKQIFTPIYLRNILANPITTDHLIAQVFGSAGFDYISSELPSLDSFEDFDPEEPPPEIEMMMRTYVFGLTIDKYFFTIFGFYLRIIRPLYLVPFNFRNDIAEFCEAFDRKDKDDIEMAFCAPPSMYDLTSLGCSLLDAKRYPDNFLDISPDHFEKAILPHFATPEAFMDFLSREHLLGKIGIRKIPENMLKFRVQLAQDTKIWLHAVVPDEFSLETLYAFVAPYFQLLPNANYTFYHDKKPNDFVEYPFVSQSSSAKNSGRNSTTLLSKIDLGYGPHMCLLSQKASKVPYQKTSVLINFELLSSSPTKSDELDDFVPRVPRVSAQLRKMFEE